MNPRISVVIPAFNAAFTVGDTVRSVMAQPLARGTFECIVVDDGSRDNTAEVAERLGALVVRLAKNQGPSAARNAGIKKARGQWIAFTDSDCVPSRRWLPALLAATEKLDASTIALAGQTIGLESNTSAARFMDLVGSLDAVNYLRHETFPWAPSCNLAYRRAELLEVGGFDEVFTDYETPELHLRMVERFGGNIKLVPSAVVMHRHRATWKGLWRQQRKYGHGYAHFLIRYSGRWPWSARREAEAWARLFPLAARAAIGRGNEGLVQLRVLIKHVAQRVGFARTFFSPAARRQFNERSTEPA